jgi:hypothetical protein
MRLMVALLLGLAGPSSATTLLAFEVPELAKLADVVVRGHVSGLAARWSGDRARIFTEAQVEVSEVLKGTMVAKVAVVQPGGVIGDVGQMVHASARFTVGEEVVLFLERRGGRYTVAGMVQGKYRVERSADGKTAWAQAALDEAAFLDPATRQPVSRRSAPVPLGMLLDQIRGALRPSAAPTSGGPSGAVLMKAQP